MSVEKPSAATTPAVPPSSGGSAYRALTPAGAVGAAAAKGPGPKPAAKAGPAAASTVPSPTQPAASKEEARPDPTRFGDWEVNGRCIDF